MEAARAAEARIRELIAMNPDEYRSWAMLAVFFNTAGTAYAEDAFQQGITAASQAMAIYPINVEAANLKAFAQESQGDHAGAIATLKDVWDLDPRYFDAGKTYMVALIGDGQLEEAHVVLTSLQSRFPDNPEVTSLTQFLDSQTKR
jgi:Tfp pilus assembly protein PilF